MKLISKKIKEEEGEIGYERLGIQKRKKSSEKGSIVEKGVLVTVV